MRRNDNKISLSALLLALEIGLVPLLFTFILCQNWRVQSRRAATHSVEHNVQRVAALFKSYLQLCLGSSDRMAQRLGNDSYRGDVEKWEEDARLLLRDYASIVGMTWLKSDLDPIWMYPHEHSREYRRQGLSEEKERKSAMLASLTHGKTTATSMVDLIAGGRGFLVYFPVHRNGKRIGLLGVAFRSESLVNGLLQNVPQPDLNVTATQDGERIYEHKSEVLSETTATAHASILDKTWSFTLAAPFEPEASPLWVSGPTLLLMAGIGFSILLGFFAYFLQVLRAQATVLQKSELRFRHFVDGVRDYAILNLDTEGRVSSWNAGGRHIKGYEESEILGKHFSIFYTAEDIAEGHPEKELEIARRDGQYREEGIRVRKDGSRFWAEVLITAVYSPQRRLLGYAKLTRDISDRIHLQNEARLHMAEVENSNQRFELMAEGASVGIWDWKDVHQQDVYWSPRFYTLLGYQDGEIPSTVDSYTQLIHPDDRQGSQIAYKKVLNEGKATSREYRLRTKSGEYRWFLSSGSLAVDQDGKPYRMVGSIQDIHARKMLEQQLREAVNARSMFLANMSHEIRTPMNGIVGMTSLLLQSELSEQARDYVDTLRRSSEVLLSLLNDILDLSKVEAGKVIIEKQSFDIRATVETAITLFSEAANDKGIYLSSVVYPSVPKLVTGDCTRFQQILSNLVSNAIKFTDSGEVSIQVAAEKSVTDHVLVTLDVIDTGIGMPPHVIDTLFTPFTQGDNSTTRRFGGTGLGLSISKKLAQLMGGDIEVASELCDGSRFRVCIPFETKAVRIAPLPSWKHIDAAVLSTNRYLSSNVTQLLSCKSAETTSFSDSIQCLKKIQSNSPPSLLLIHWQPERAEECEAAAASAQSLHIPVLWIVPERADAVAEQKLPRVKLPLRQSTFLRKVAECANLDHLQTRLAVLEADGNLPRALPLTKSPLCLIAEDNSTNQKVIRRMLENLGMRCDVVSNGAEALVAVQNIQYDLILMDCLMPEMDGYQSAQAIRRLPHSRFSQIPIVAVTANVSEMERSRCLQAGMNEYVAKPIVFAELHQIIAKCLGQLPTDTLEQAA